MSDIRRVALNSAPTTEKEKKVKKFAATFRFVLALGESNSTSCPEYSFTDLVKRKKTKHQNSENPLDIEDDDADVVRIAQQFEAKYGGKPFKPGGRKRTQDMDDYFDLGEGYDTEDSFIDNTEAYDEVIPSTLTTKHGGFYINQGKLDFRSISDDSNDDFQQPELKKKKKPIIESESEEETGEELHKRFKAMKRKKLLESREGEKKKKKLMTGVNGEVIKKKKKKNLDLHKQKNTTLVKAAPETKTVTANTQSTSPNTQTTVTSSTVSSAVNPVSTTPSSGVEATPTPSITSATSPVSNPLKQDNTDISLNLDDPMQNLCSVILEEAMNDESSSKSEDEEKKIGSQSMDKERQLPSQLPPKLLETIEIIKKEAKERKEGKSKFFSASINKLLLKIEIESLKLAKSHRSAIFNHLGEHLPSGKKTLLRRAKKLREEENEGDLKGPIEKLKAAISKVMPALEEQHEKAVARLRHESQTEQAEAAKEEPSTESEEEEGKTDGKKFIRRRARRKFEWTPEIREKYLSIVQSKMKKFDVSKSKNQQPEEYLKSYLETEIKPIWPSGWMNTRLLYKIARAVLGESAKGTKPKRTPAAGKTSPVPEVAPPQHVSRKEDVIEISSTCILDDDIEDKKNVVVNLCDKSPASPNQYLHQSISVLGSSKPMTSMLLPQVRTSTGPSSQTTNHPSLPPNNPSVGAFVSKVPEKGTGKSGSTPVRKAASPESDVEIIDSPSPITKQGAFPTNSVSSSHQLGDVSKAISSIVSPQSSSTPKGAFGSNPTPSSSTSSTLNSSQSFLQAFNQYLNQTQSKKEEMSTSKGIVTSFSSKPQQQTKPTGINTGSNLPQKKTQQLSSQPEKIVPTQPKTLNVTSSHPVKLSQDYKVTNPLPKGVSSTNGRNSLPKSPVVTMNRITASGSMPSQKQSVTFAGSKGPSPQTQKNPMHHQSPYPQTKSQNIVSHHAIHLVKKKGQYPPLNSGQPVDISPGLSSSTPGSRAGKSVPISSPVTVLSSTKQGSGSAGGNKYPSSSPTAQPSGASSTSNSAMAAQRNPNSGTMPFTSQIKSGTYLGTSMPKLGPQQQQLHRQHLQQQQRQHAQIKSGTSTPLTVRTSPISPSSLAAGKNLSPSNSLIHSASLLSSSRTSTPSPQKSPISPNSNPSSLYDRIQSQIRNQEATEAQGLKALAMALNFDAISTPSPKHLAGHDAGNGSSRSGNR